METRQLLDLQEFTLLKGNVAGPDRLRLLELYSYNRQPEPVGAFMELRYCQHQLVKPPRCYEETPDLHTATYRFYALCVNRVIADCVFYVAKISD
ncbi:hypothetical protein GCM10028807_18930 [Spirosoma daeguense]